MLSISVTILLVEKREVKVLFWCLYITNIDRYCIIKMVCDYYIFRCFMLSKIGFYLTHSITMNCIILVVF